jgi:Flp pilus assembly protein TadG
VIGSQLVTIIQRPGATRRPSERGQSLVEFALVLPVFMLLVFGILDGGRAIVAYNDVSQSARNVARVASVSCFDTATRCSSASGTPIGDAMAAQIGTSGPATCIDPNTNAAATNCTAGDIIRVRAQAAVTLVTPLIAQALGGTVAVDATSEATVIQ